MKVLAICGSPRPQGNTRLLLSTALKVLEGQGIATDYLSLHDKQVLPCRACLKCAQEKNRGATRPCLALRAPVKVKPPGQPPRRGLFRGRLGKEGGRGSGLLEAAFLHGRE